MQQYICIVTYCLICLNVKKIFAIRTCAFGALGNEARQYISMETCVKYLQMLQDFI